MLSILEKHELCLYPEVRVQTSKALGSGTVIYSDAIPEEPGRFETYILTNHHVVDDLISVKDEWSTLLQRNVKRDVKGKPKIETFKYDYVSRVVGGTAYQCEIACYDKNEDLALLKIEGPDAFQYVARLYPRDKFTDLVCSLPVVNVGCGLGQKPLMTFGYLTGFGYEIDNRDYIMISAASYFGNSGGATFLADTGEFIGVPARISVQAIGWSADIVSHIGFSVPCWRIYEFLEDQIYDFIFDPELDSAVCAERREKKREQEELKMLRSALAGEG